MSWLMWLGVAVLFVAALTVIVVVGRRVAAARGARLVKCPENQQPAAVNVASLRAALGGRLELSECSRWPERSSCGRECLTQIERADDGCLVRSMVTAWYKGKVCAICGREVGQVDWLERKPGLIDQGGVPKLWQDVAPEALPAVLATHRPVCFDCSVAETFRREHPELVLDNPWKH